ncbi:isochorismatase [Bacillus sp. FJAT-27264]|uniref:cysteine hydrolase family protein n=1 Tax=Paenibacillus sp. (strain DSM 101736 / FJAT-27264) TaxID=1850362 RepID=UPI00080813F4|nr:isochorismatase family cysteine hydrolase [Bacillus sp. FJAT-27264]OBZ19015.1 isochorismatase [Bacillus sp. FJAT-27264]
MNPLGNYKSGWKVSKEWVDLRRESRQPLHISIEAKPQNLTLDLEKSAIVIVDMQNDFCTPGGWLHSIGVDTSPLLEPVNPLNRLLPALRQAGVPVIWLNWGNREDRLNLSPSVLHVYDADGTGNGIGSPLPENGSRVLEKGSWGAATIDVLQESTNDIYVDKYRMSGFWDTPLDSILRNLEVSTLFFAGVNLDQCVMHTLQDAVCLGYDAILLEDCCATSSPSFCKEATLYNIKTCYGFIAASEALLHAYLASTREDE